jgi:hypothetical protein
LKGTSQQATPNEDQPIGHERSHAVHSALRSDHRVEAAQFAQVFLPSKA